MTVAREVACSRAEFAEISSELAASSPGLRGCSVLLSSTWRLKFDWVNLCNQMNWIALKQRKLEVYQNIF